MGSGVEIPVRIWIWQASGSVTGFGVMQLSALWPLGIRRVAGGTFCHPVGRLLLLQAVMGRTVDEDDGDQALPAHFLETVVGLALGHLKGLGDVLEL